MVFAWQKSASDKVKNDLQGQINTLRGQVQQLTKTAPTTNNNQCVAEGKFGNPPESCCSGLTKIDWLFSCDGGASVNCPSGCYAPDSLTTQQFICANCGDGVCSSKNGIGENKCNCPADCKDSADVTADWKTYTNTQNAYKIKYPEAQGIKVFATDPNSIELRPQSAWEAPTGSEGGWEPTKLGISVKAYSGNLSLPDNILNVWNNILGRKIDGHPVSKSQIKTVTISNNQFYNLDDIENLEQNYYVIHNSKLYTLVCFGNQEFRDQCPQMIAIFEFIK